MLGGGALVEEKGRSPELSVVLQISPLRERAERCLRSLIGQEAIERMEILLLDYAARDFPALAGSEHPSVRRLGKDSLEPFGQSRSGAVGLTTGRIVAFIEDHCLAHPGWAAAILAAHSQGWDGVGPEVHNGNPGAGISDAVHLINYSRWFPPAEAGETDMIVGHNSSYVRESLLAYGEELATLLRCDTILQWQLARDGGRLAVSPEVRISHMNETDIPSLLRGSFLWNRMFAPTRANVFHWSASKRSAWVLFAPLIPFVRSIKLVWEVLNHRREFLWRCVRALPIVLVAHTAAAGGRIVGLVAGLGEAEVSFLRYEISQDRPIASGNAAAPPA